MDRARGVAPWLALATAVVTALYVVRERTVYGWMPAHDLYAYFYPKVVYALASLRADGRGLLWNPFQNCGQPFFAISQTGLLYPPYLLFLVLDAERALRGVMTLHLVIAGLGAYFLGRALGARPLAASVGALAFEMSNPMLWMTVSSPTHCAPFAWMPVAVLCAERLLRSPSLRRLLALAAVLAVTILPGMPQTVFFTYQLIGFRLLWELVFQRPQRPWTLAGMTALALGLGPLLAAVQLLPEIEVARQSIRSGALTVTEMNAGPTGLAWLPAQLAARSSRQPFVLVPCIAAAAAFFAPRTRRLALFYGVATFLSVALVAGPGTLVFDLYSLVPGTGLFRQPARFLWVAGFCLAVLAALGSEALAARRRDDGRAGLLVALLVMLGLVATFRVLTGNGLAPAEWGAAGIVLAAAVVAAFVPRLVAATPLLLLAGLVLQLIRAPASNVLFLLPDAPPFEATAPVFTWLRERLQPQDRVHLVHEAPAATRFAFMDKTASLFRVPALLDYEPLVTERFAAFSVMLRSGRPMRNRNEVIYANPQLGPSFSRRLLDLSASRYLVVAPKLVAGVERVRPAFRRVADVADLALFENPQALPRVFYVPRIEVVDDPAALLQRLATGPDDLRSVALVEQAPASGFLGGTPSTSAAAVTFARDDPELVSLQVEAPARGFLVLSDQYFPGWVATVNGQQTPIQRANYVFRLVEVPAGSSTVQFRYAPRSLQLGATISAMTVLALGLLLWAGKTRRVRSLPDSALEPS